MADAVQGIAGLTDLVVTQNLHLDLKMILTHLAFLVRECVAILVWSFLVIKVFIFDIDIYLINKIAPDYLWLLDLKILLFMFAISIIWLILGRRSFPKLFAYIAGYPLVLLLWRFPIICFKHWAIVIVFAPVLYNAIKRFRSTFILYTFAMASIAIIIFSTSRWLLLATIVVLMVFQVGNIIRIFQEAFNPSLFAELAELTRKIKASNLDFIFKNKLDTPTSPPSASDNESDSSNPLMPAYIAHACTDIVAYQVYKVIKTRKYDMYLALSWLYTVFVTIFVYAFIYFGVNKFDQHAFSSTSKPLEFFDFLYFSIGIITTAGGSSIHGASLFANVLSITEYLHIPLLLITIVFIGFTTQRETYRENAEDFRLALRELSNIIEIQINNTYQTTALAIEVAIHKHNAWLVARLRRARGVPDLIEEEHLPKSEQAADATPPSSMDMPPKN